MEVNPHYSTMPWRWDGFNDNQVWDLVKLPKGAKAIGYNWDFKTKIDSLGNVERYKARLVIKEFTQQERIDYSLLFQRRIHIK